MADFNVVSMIRNLINPRIANASNADFDSLLAKRDITSIKESMENRFVEIDTALSEYRTETHKVNFREDKVVKNSKGNMRKEESCKLPIPYQVYINEIALVFLYGRPVKWQQMSDGTDDAFSRFLELIKTTRFDSKVREAKRLAGAETESAMLFRAYKEKDGTPNLQIKVLARSKGDEIYTRWDEYGNLLAIAWGRYVKEAQDKTVYHFDLFTATKIYRCRQLKNWEVKEEDNIIGKIPVLLFQQDKEWDGVQNLIERYERNASRAGDTNDYFSDPILLASADMVKSLPEKSEDGKVAIVKGVGSISEAMRYLTWDSAPQSKQMEQEFLDDAISRFSFTPKITLDSLKSVSQLSAKALRTVMMLATIKAERRKESHSELMDRASNIFKAVIGNVLDISLKSQCDNLSIAHEFQEPFGDDVADAISNIIKASDSEIMSRETAIELNPLVKDSIKEKERINEQKEKQAQQEAASNMMDVFGQAQ